MWIGCVGGQCDCTTLVSVIYDDEEEVLCDDEERMSETLT